MHGSIYASKNDAEGIADNGREIDIVARRRYRRFEEVVPMDACVEEEGDGDAVGGVS